MGDNRYDRDQEVRAIQEAAERMAKRLNARVEINPAHLQDFGAFGSGAVDHGDDQGKGQTRPDQALEC